MRPALLRPTCRLNPLVSLLCGRDFVSVFLYETTDPPRRPGRQRLRHPPRRPAVDAQTVILMRSRTYMNESGIAVSKVASFAGITPDHLIVVHDEIDLDPGRLRLKKGGGDNGHNGLKSIRAHLRTGDFIRVR